MDPGSIPGDSTDSVESAMKFWLAYNTVGLIMCIGYSLVTSEWTCTVSWVLGFAAGFAGAQISSILSRRRNVS